MEWTHSKLAALAPNQMVLEKAQSIASKRHWTDMGANGQYLWGRCKSSGEKLYETISPLQGNEFRCTCPKPGRPCRHNLALLLLLLKNSDHFPLNDQLPEFAAQLQLQRPPDLSSPIAKPPFLQDENAQKRLQRMLSGMGELELWLKDLVRQGLSVAYAQPNSFWDDFASKMVDAKLGSIARRIRSFPNMMQAPDWHGLLLEEIGALFLLVQSFKQIEQLEPDLQETILSLAGVNQKKETLLAQQKAISDKWLVIGHTEGTEESLRYRRTWLMGIQSERMALILDYAWGQQAFEWNWRIGTSLIGDLVFYPDAYPLRALVKKIKLDYSPIERLFSYPSFESFLQAYAAALGCNPWVSSFPGLLEKVVIILDNKRPFILDTAQNSLPLDIAPNVLWKLLAISQGGVLHVFGEWNGKAFLPLAALSRESVIDVTERWPEISEIESPDV
ncbi:MAG TPA: hypothetical protein PKA00_02360 [Saprospiraceae bacterium]|nr:hypothetical protein [Saprospiraceae bacterium]HMQ81715.1 hypothetical protein [Saprospiraceae bacterium]